VANLNCLMIRISIFAFLSLADACSIYLQSNSIKYLTASQLVLHRLTDTCTTTCSDGYYGVFCQDLSKFSNLPMGPWNQAGYCTNGPGILRSMTVDVSDIYSIQYTKRDSTLIGISKAGFTTSVISEISLYSRIITPVLYPTPSGTLDALIVRNGVVYVARTVQVSGLDTYDVAILKKSLSLSIATPIQAIQTKAVLIEVCVDKGTTTFFVYGGGKVSACYPNGVCNQWISISTISGMISGPDCQHTLYASSSSSIIRINSAGYTTLRVTPSTIYCLTGVPEFNVLLYKSKNNMWQINLGTGATSSIPLGVAQTQEVVCSSDVSEKNNQILIVQNGIIRTLEAVQEPCSFGQTSQSLLCNSSAQCTSCPPPPANAYHAEGGVECEWLCLPGYAPIGSRCVGQVVQPCPSNYRADSPGLCAPATIPWADKGRYVTATSYSSQLSFPTPNAPVYLLTNVHLPNEGSALIHTVPGQFFSEKNGAWAALTFKAFSPFSCPYSGQNSYYYLSSRAGVLWVAFTMQRAEGTQHCLWAVNATNVVSSGELRVIQAWTLDGPLCSATGDGGWVYAILCGYNYVSYAKLESGSTLSPVIGSPNPGYIDGVFQAARLSGPSSLVAHDSRLYITDTNNCVIREADLSRGVVRTVAGTADICQRADGVEATLVYPTDLTYTPYDGFFLFVDRFAAQNAIRQFHVYTSTVTTVQVTPFLFAQITGITASHSGIFAQSQRQYFIYSASWEYCPAGTSSLPGNAFAASGCTPCPAFYYSDKVSGVCKRCSSPACTLPGQLLAPCQPDADAYCGSCANKPSLKTSKYTGASSIPTPGDCEWVYTPPCPAGYYSNKDVCSSCPVWSTSDSGSTSISSCRCLGGALLDSCVIPSPFLLPAACGPLEACDAYTEPVSQFPILPSCTSLDTDSYAGVCPCQAGEYIQQIYPKVCTPCPAGLYSPAGRGCRVCPYLAEPSSFKSSCRCAVGTYDVDLTQDLSCVCGPGNAFFASIGCIPCPVNAYTPTPRAYDSQADVMCIQCPEGMWAAASSSACVECPLGQFRQQEDTCQSCQVGAYAPDPTTPLCVECSAGCNGRREIQCPTDSSLFMCSDCPPPRPNSAFNGQRDCATSCHPGFYELDNACVACAEYRKTTCPAGNRLVACSPYADAGCIGCVNSSMPLNFAAWSYKSDSIDGPNLVCEWQCMAGYSLQRFASWECVKAGEWNVWDLFTV
jgi:hypothetical protein